MKKQQVSYNDEELLILKLFSDKTIDEKITIINQTKIDCGDETHRETLARLMLKLSSEKCGK